MFLFFSLFTLWVRSAAITAYAWVCHIPEKPELRHLAWCTKYLSSLNSGARIELWPFLFTLEAFRLNKKLWFKGLRPFVFVWQAKNHGDFCDRWCILSWIFSFNMAQRYTASQVVDILDISDTGGHKGKPKNIQNCSLLVLPEKKDKWPNKISQRHKKHVFWYLSCNNFWC